MPKYMLANEAREYDCCVCGQPIKGLMPSGLKGEYAHALCKIERMDYRRDRILDAEFLTVQHEPDAR